MQSKGGHKLGGAIDVIKVEDTVTAERNVSRRWPTATRVKNRPKSHRPVVWRITDKIVQFLDRTDDFTSNLDECNTTPSATEHAQLLQSHLQ